MNTEELITYVRHIERVLGPTQSYKLLEPFDWCSGDIKIAQAELVEAGRKVGNFLSLQQLTFLLLWADQEPGIAGHIHLSYGQQSVDVEVSTKLHPFPKCVLATVAHEYSHKVLHRNGLDHAD